MQNELVVGDIVKIDNYEAEYNGKYAVIDSLPGEQDSSYYNVTLVNSTRTLLMRRNELELAKFPPDPECPFPMGSMVNSIKWRWEKSFKVIGWEKVGDKWTVTLDDSKGSPVRGYDPKDLAIEEQCPFSIGDRVRRASSDSTEVGIVDGCEKLTGYHDLRVWVKWPDRKTHCAVNWIELAPDRPEPEVGTPVLWNGEWYARTYKPDCYFNLSKWSWNSAQTWDKMQDTATVPGP